MIGEGCGLSDTCQAIEATIQLLADGTAVLVLSQAGDKIIIKSKSALGRLRDLLQAFDLNPPWWLKFADEHPPTDPIADAMKKALEEEIIPAWEGDPINGYDVLHGGHAPNMETH